MFNQEEDQVTLPNHFILEGIDRVGKDKLLHGIQHRLGYHQVLHYQKPMELGCYAMGASKDEALCRYQEASFRTMFQILRGAPLAKVIFNRAHLGECVYAPIYRRYSGDYVFNLEREFNVHQLSHVRLVLLVEDFAVSRHFVDDGRSLGGAEKRQDEQALFRGAFDASVVRDKRLVCVTDRETGQFRSPDSILDEVLA
ncbi:hypothetical protein WME95_37160 [Sorangium sp. So ce327]|uniref:hypothetical protein n=1 Tax=Sorangium sp. So ce327 TaxID=3133301 RepID=UPI003F5E165B